MKTTPIIVVQAYKSSGKFYSNEVGRLKPEHCDNKRLHDEIQANSELVHSYSPIEGGFKPGYYYVVNVDYRMPNDGFCMFLLDRTKS